MRQSILALAVALVVAAAGAAAARGGSQNMGGCGIGSLLFKDSGTGPQILAATTNGSFYNQQFGITTGTLGCNAADDWRIGQLQRERYVAANYRSLSRELAVGKGEFASSLATVMGCQSGALPRFLTVAKTKHAALFPAEGATPSSTLRALEFAIAADDGLSSACSL